MFRAEHSPKGADTAVYRALEPYFKLEMVPVLVKYSDSYYEGSLEYNESSAEVYRCTSGDIAGTSGAVEKLSCYNLDITDMHGVVLRSNEQGYIDHVGNECQPGLINNIYFNRLLIVRSRD